MNPSDDTPIYLILGATGAVGSTLARRLSARGARVVVAGRRVDALEALADEVAGVPFELDARDAKAGIEGLVRAAATTYAHAGIRINAVAPGLVDSAMSRRIIDNPKALETSLALHPLARVGRPEEIASLIDWFLGPGGEWVTGQVWGVDGGLAALKERRSA